MKSPRGLQVLTTFDPTGVLLDPRPSNTDQELTNQVLSMDEIALAA